MTEGRKDDAWKPRPTLVQRDMANALQQVLQVAEYGARKYAPGNWLQVPDAVQRYTDAMLRHQQAHLRGEVRDPESGLPHMAHAAWCALAVLELGARKPLASLARGLPLYEAALAEGLLYLQGPTTIAIKDRRGQKLREIHGKTLLGAWALLKQMPDVENLLKRITARVPARPAREEYWRAELAKDPVCAEGLAKGWLRVARRGALIVEVIRTPAPTLWRYAREPVTPADMIDWVKRVRTEPATLRDLVYAHPDMRLRQLFDAGKLTRRSTETGGWRVRLGQLSCCASTLDAAFSFVAADGQLISRMAAKLPQSPKDRAIAHWTQELSRDPICARMLATRQLQLIHEPRTMLLKFRNSMLPLHAPHCTADEAIRWVHDGLRT